MFLLDLFYTQSPRLTHCMGITFYLFKKELTNQTLPKNHG